MCPFYPILYFFFFFGLSFLLFKNLGLLTCTCSSGQNGAIRGFRLSIKWPLNSYPVVISLGIWKGVWKGSALSG